MNKNNEELHIVTEQGVFGDMTIQDPTKKKVHTSEEIEALIEATNRANKENLK